MKVQIKSFCLFLSLVLGIFLVDAKAGSFGYSYMEIYQDNPASSTRVYVETGTVLSYTDWNWYDPGIEGFLYEDSILIASTPRVMNYEGPEVVAWADVTARYGSTYTIHGDHWVRAIIWYNTSSGPVYRDYFGFNYYQGNFPSPYNFYYRPQGYYSYRFYKAATTRVTLSVSRPLQLNSVDRTGGLAGNSYLTTLRGTGLFGNGNGQGANQTVQVSGSGVTATVRPTLPNTIEVLDVEINIASDAQPGDRNLTLTVNGQTSNSINFRVGDNSPQITSISPPQGEAGDQVSVTITGTHFGFNPDVEIAGYGVARAINSSTTTEIEAIFSVDTAADPGPRAVNVRSRGITGTGFLPVPGNSDRSNVVDFDVLAGNPRVEIGDIGSIEKGRVKTITVRTVNAPSGHVTKLRFKNQPTPPATRPVDGWKTGEAVFVDANGIDRTEIEYMGDQPQEVRIRGYQRSTSKDNIKLEARFNNDPDVKKDESFTVSSVAFVEDAECTGFDDVKFQVHLTYDGRLAYVARGSNNKVRAKIMPSGASGTFKLEPSESNISVSPAVISSTSEQVVTISANTTATDHPTLRVKADDPSSLTNYAEVLGVEVLNGKDRNVVIYAVTEDNDDVQAIPTGQGQPNSVAYVFDPGVNNFIDTVAGGDDWLAPVPIGLRPPGYSSRSRRVFTGLNGILETLTQGDDEIYSSKDKSLQLQYAPITEISQGMADAVCVTSGANQFLDTRAHNHDSEAVDPTNSSLTVITTGGDGRCDTEANDDDVLPPSVLRDAGSAGNFRVSLLNYLNNITWLRQANITFTVSTTIQTLELNYDLNRDGKLQHPVNTVPASYEEIDAISANQNPSGTDLHIYYVGMDSTNADIRGLSFLNTQHIWFNPQGFTFNGANMTAAHEIGHAIGNPHTSEDISAIDYQRDLMYFGYLNGTVNQCRIRLPQWDKQRLMAP